MSFTSEELNFLVYRYLLESGFQHAAYIFGVESNANKSNVIGAFVPASALINIVQKGLLHTKAEITVGDDDSALEILENLSLIDAVAPNIVEMCKNQIKEHVKAQKSTVAPSQTIVVEGAEMPIDAPLQNIADSVIEVNIEIPRGEVTVLRGHKSEATICSWNPIADLFATGSSDGTTRIWDLSKTTRTTNNLVLRHHILKDGVKVASDNDVTSLNWNCNGTLLVTGSYEGNACIWTTSGILITTLYKHNGPIFAVKWNKCSSYIVSAGVDSKTAIWDTSNGKCLKQFSCHSAAVLDVDWKSNTTFASCSTDKNIHVCKLNSRRPVMSFKGHTSEVNSIQWNPQGNLLASGSDDTTVKIWSMTQEDCVQDLKDHAMEVCSLKWSPTGPGTAYPNTNLLLASASYDPTVRLWDVEKGSSLLTLTKHTNSVYSVAFSPDGKFLASGSYDRTVKIWSTQNGQLVRNYKCTKGFFEVCWNSRGDKVGATCEDGRVFVFDLRKL